MIANNSNQRKSVRDIIDADYDAITNVAAIIGIDWSQHADSYNVPDNNRNAATIDTKHKGKCGYLITTHTNKYGQEFPAITFSSFTAGGCVAKWSGFRALAGLTTDTISTVNAQQCNDDIARKQALRQADTLNKRAASLAEFNAMPTCTKSQYLSRKMLDGYCDLFKSTRQGGIAYPLTDLVTSNCVGYGWISDRDSSKRGRSSGSGDCIAVYDVNRDSDAPVVYVTEGMSDALTIADVTGCRVIAALGATNIHAVAEHLATTTDKRIVIAADNDSAGLTVAKQTSYAYSVVTPINAKDYSDVLTGEGVDELAAQLQHTVYINAVHQCQQYCDFAIVPNAINLLIAEKGTGKTTAIKRHLASADGSVLIVSHRRSLARKLAADFCCVNYEDVIDAAGKDSLGAQSRLVISVEQLNHIGMPVPRYDTVIIDECEQVLSHACTSSTVKAHKTAAQYIVALCNKSNTVILSDANPLMATNYVIDSVSKHKTGKLVNRLINTYRPRKVRGDTIVLCDHVKDAYARFETHLESKERVVFISDSKSETIKAHKVALQHVNADRVLLINSDTIDKHAAALNDINSAVKQYDVVIYSPALGTGFSVDRGHGFNNAVLVMTGKSIDAESVSQMLARFRELGSYYGYVGNMTGRKPTDINEAIKQYIYNPVTAMDKEIQQQTLVIDDDGQVVIDTYSHLRMRLECDRARSSNNFRCAVLNVLADEGFNISYDDVDREVSDTLTIAKAEVKADKQVTKDTQINERIRSLAVLDIDDTLATLIVTSKTSSLVRAMALAAITRDDAKALDTQAVAQYRAGKRAAIDLQHKTLKRDLLLDVLANIGLDLITGEYTHVDLATVPASQYARKTNELYRFALVKDNNKAWGQLLNVWGIKTTSKQIRVGKDRVRQYCISDDSVTLLKGLWMVLNGDLLGRLDIKLSDTELDALMMRARDKR